MSENNNDLSSALIQHMADLHEQEVLALVQERITRGDDPIDIVEDCRQGMILVGKRYEQQQYYLSGLILAGEILREVMEIVQPLTERKYDGKSLGLIILGTVEGDIHDAGKDLFQVLLKVHGFTVLDLGVNVPPREFLTKAKEMKPIAIGLSCLVVGGISSHARNRQPAAGKCRHRRHPHRHRWAGGWRGMQICGQRPLVCRCNGRRALVPKTVFLITNFFIYCWNTFT